MFTHVTEENPKTLPLVTSSLGLNGLRAAFEEGSYSMRTTCLDTIMKNGAQHTPFASHVEANYKFSDHNFDLRERYTRISGKDIRYGKIIEELDALAGDCSYKYLL